MENKYYVPDIEEFYIGFEFEYLAKEGHSLRSDVPIEEMTWIKSDDFSMDFCDNDADTISERGYVLNKNRVRVKYLDAEDIESLGYTKQEILKTDDYIWFTKELDKVLYTIRYNIEALDNLGTNATLIYKTDFNKISFLSGNPRETVLFRGKVKNKSELKELLVQLGIQVTKH